MESLSDGARLTFPTLAESSAAAVRYWTIRLQLGAMNSVAIQSMLGVNPTRARGLLRGRIPYTIDELVLIATKMALPIDALVALPLYLKSHPAPAYDDDREGAHRHFRAVMWGEHGGEHDRWREVDAWRRKTVAEDKASEHNEGHRAAVAEAKRLAQLAWDYDGHWNELDIILFHEIDTLAGNNLAFVLRAALATLAAELQTTFPSRGKMDA